MLCCLLLHVMYCQEPKMTRSIQKQVKTNTAQDVLILRISALGIIALLLLRPMAG